MPDDQFAVHDITIKDISTLGPAGTVQFVKQLTFWVGTHGPFIKTFPAATWDANLAKKAIADQVQELRLITGA